MVGVHNGMTALAESLDSVLSQSGLRFELVVVDDGSTDGSGQYLQRLAEGDYRVKVVRQEHQGLTAALIRGCAVARGHYIARQDVGDVSSTGRLRAQIDCLKARPSAVFVSCGTRFVGPGGEHLYDVLRDEVEVARALRSHRQDALAGPAHHGSVVFRRDAYEKVGGYRSEFYLAQDLDLWVRLAEIGDHAVVPRILYRALVSPGSLSGTYRREQRALTRLISEAARRRRAGVSEADVLARAAAIRPTRSSRPGRVARSRALYFIAACLRRQHQETAKAYFRRAVRENPLHLKAWYRMLTAR